MATENEEDYGTIIKRSRKEKQSKKWLARWKKYWRGMEWTRYIEYLID